MRYVWRYFIFASPLLPMITENCKSVTPLTRRHVHGFLSLCVGVKCHPHVVIYFSDTWSSNQLINVSHYSFTFNKLVNVNSATMSICGLLFLTSSVRIVFTNVEVKSNSDRTFYSIFVKYIYCHEPYLREKLFLLLHQGYYNTAFINWKCNLWLV